MNCLRYYILGTKSHDFTKNTILLAKLKTNSGLFSIVGSSHDKSSFDQPRVITRLIILTTGQIIFQYLD